MLAEDALHGDELRAVLVEPLLQALLDGDQAVAEVGVGGRAHDSHAQHGQRAPRAPFDDADTAPGQSRVHPQYAHAVAPLLDHLFVQAIGCHRQSGGPTGVCPVGPPP